MALTTRHICLSSTTRQIILASATQIRRVWHLLPRRFTRSSAVGWRSNTWLYHNKKAVQSDYPLWEVYSRNTRDSLYTNTIHKQKWNDFACKTDESVDLWRNGVFYSKLMCCIAREYSLREYPILRVSRQRVLKKYKNRGYFVLGNCDTHLLLALEKSRMVEQIGNVA